MKKFVKIILVFFFLFWASTSLARTCGTVGGYESPSYGKDTCGANCKTECFSEDHGGLIWWCCPKGCEGEPCPAGQICILNPLSYCTFGDLIDTIINFIFVVALAIAPLMILVAAFYFISAGGDPKRINTAKHIMLYAIIGLVVIFFAKGLIDVIKYILGAS